MLCLKCCVQVPVPVQVQLQMSFMGRADGAATPFLNYKLPLRCLIFSVMQVPSTTILLVLLLHFLHLAVSVMHRFGVRPYAFCSVFDWTVSMSPFRCTLRVTHQWVVLMQQCMCWSKCIEGWYACYCCHYIIIIIIIITDLISGQDNAVGSVHLSVRLLLL